MKNILVISGSQRKKGTGIDGVNILKVQFDSALYNFEVVHLSDFSIQFCIGCTACFKKDGNTCPLKDDVLTMVEKMKAADGIVFVSPIYGMNISGQLKSFMDRIAFLYHKPELIAKPVITVFSTDLAGVKPMAIYMDYMLSSMGMRTVGSVGLLSGRLNTDQVYREKITKQFGKLALSFQEELKRTPFPQATFKELFHFTKWQIKQKYSENQYPGDYNYWKDKGWLEGNYYYQTKMKAIDGFRISLLRRVLTKKIRKNSMA